MEAGRTRKGLVVLSGEDSRMAYLLVPVVDDFREGS